LSGIKINDPILDRDSASKGNNNSIFSGHISSEAENVKDRVIEGFGLDDKTFTFVTLLYEQYLQVQLLISASVPKVLAQMKPILLPLVVL
jgi:hypothetical protein